MARCFADTSYYIAPVNPDDEAHELALKLTSELRGEIVTTAWVLNELANYLVRPPNRVLFLDMLAQMRADPGVTIVPMGQDTFDRGLTLYAERLDKSWSVTDCISFLIMEDLSIADALTSDHHFEQAGFNVLLN